LGLCPDRWRRASSFRHRHSRPHRAYLVVPLTNHFCDTDFCGVLLSQGDGNERFSSFGPVSVIVSRR
jgi:hypothetical protein